MNKPVLMMPTKTNTFADALIESTSSTRKSCTKLKKAINRGKRSKTLSEVKPVGNISENLQSFVE